MGPKHMLLRQLRGQYSDEMRESPHIQDARRTFPYVSGRVDAPDKVIRQSAPSRNQRFCDGDPENLPHKISCGNYCGGPEVYPTKFPAEIIAGAPIFTPRKILRILRGDPEEYAFTSTERAIFG